MKKFIITNFCLIADRAKQIQNFAKINIDNTDKIIRDLKEENEKLKKLLEKESTVAAAAAAAASAAVATNTASTTLSKSPSQSFYGIIDSSFSIMFLFLFLDFHFHFHFSFYNR